MVEIDRTFAGTFDIDISDSVTIADGQVREFRAMGIPPHAPCVRLDITTPDDCWQGAFFGGRDELSLATTLPKADALLVVVGGVSYTVSVDRPEQYDVVAIRPIRRVLPALASGVLLLVGFTSVGAIGVSGRIEWIADDLVSDGFSEVRLTDGAVILRGFDASSASDVTVTVDLVDGRVRERQHGW